MGQGIYAIYGDRGLVGYCRLYAVSLTGRKGQKHVCLHSTNCTIAHAVTQYPPFFGVVKTVSIPFGQYPPKLGSEGSRGVRVESGESRGSRVFSRVFRTQNNFFLGRVFFRVFRLNVWEKRVKNKKFVGKDVSALTAHAFPTMRPRFGQSV